MPKIGPLKKKIASQKLINSYFLNETCRGDKSTICREDSKNSIAYMTLGSQQRFNERKRSLDIISISQNFNTMDKDEPANCTTTDNPDNAYGQKSVPCDSDKSKLTNIQVLHSRNGSG